MNILVTGASGLIGYELCKQLVKNNHKVFAIDNMSRGNKIPDCNEFYCKDLSKSLNFLNYIKDSIEIIYHLAAINGTSNFYNRPNEVLLNNTKTDLNVFEFSKKCNNLKKFLYASSSELMSHTHFCDESKSLIIDDISNPRYSYKISKIASENYLFNSNLPWLIIRYFNVYGVETKSGHFVYDQIQNHKNKVFEIIGSEETRCFTYVEDAVKATIGVSDNCPIKNIINIGNSEELTILEATKIISQCMGYNSVEYKFISGLKGSPKKRKPNLNKLINYYPNYSPISFKEGIKKILNYEKSK